MVTESVVKIYDITMNQFVLFLMFVVCAANKIPLLRYAVIFVKSSNSNLTYVLKLQWLVKIYTPPQIKFLATPLLGTYRQSQSRVPIRSYLVHVRCTFLMSRPYRPVRYIFFELIHYFLQDKDLGVVIDSNLQFNNHILGKVKTANRILRLIKRCSRISTSKVSCNSTKLWFAVTWSMPRQYGAHKVKSVEALEGVQRRTCDKDTLPGFLQLDIWRTITAAQVTYPAVQESSWRHDRGIQDTPWILRVRPWSSSMPTTVHDLSEYQRSHLEVVPTTVTSELQKVLIHCESSRTME